MFDVISTWNLSRPDEAVDDFIGGITLRGYERDAVGLTGEFKSALSERKIKALSVGNIADKICPTQRDLYFTKGMIKVKISDQMTWGRKAGKLVEQYFYELYKHTPELRREKIEDQSRLARWISQACDFFNLQSRRFIFDEQVNYRWIIDETNRFNELHSVGAKEAIEEMFELEEITAGSSEGDTEWLKTIMYRSGQIESGLKALHSVLKQPGFVDTDSLEIERELKPDTLGIGINAPTTPDFIIPEYSIVGDIKTGIKFEMKYQLTCAGYALAYENETKKDINWGIVFFVPTRIPSRYARILNYPQIHIFPINQELRQWFLDKRDEAYNVISQPQAPSLPEVDKRDQCPQCKYLSQCIKEGLTIN